MKKNNLEEEEEFFDDNMPKFRVKKNQVGLEHNLLAIQFTNGKIEIMRFFSARAGK